MTKNNSNKLAVVAVVVFDKENNTYGGEFCVEKEHVSTVGAFVIQ